MLVGQTTALPRLPTRLPGSGRRVNAAAGRQEEIYIGKGKVIKDDPSKYPFKDQWSGGWAGGETGLQNFVNGQGLGKGKTVRQGPATKLLGGKDVLYVGRGNYVRDDATKYPTRDEFSGGFAGGERGVTQFAEKGDLKFDEEFRPQV